MRLTYCETGTTRRVSDWPVSGYGTALGRVRVEGWARTSWWRKERRCGQDEEEKERRARRRWVDVGGREEGCGRTKRRRRGGGKKGRESKKGEGGDGYNSFGCLVEGRDERRFDVCRGQPLRRARARKEALGS